jgi:hypothetical protein
VSAIQIVSVTEGGLAPLWAGCRTYPSRKALASIAGRVRALTRRLSHPTLAALLRQLNLVLRDWCTYFGHGVSKATFGYLDQTGSCCSNRYSWRAGCVETRVSGSEGGLNLGPEFTQTEGTSAGTQGSSVDLGRVDPWVRAQPGGSCSSAGVWRICRAAAQYRIAVVSSSPNTTARWSGSGPWVSASSS